MLENTMDVSDILITILTIKIIDVIGCFRKINHKNKIIHINLEMWTLTQINKSKVNECIISSSISTEIFLDVRHKEN